MPEVLSTVETSKAEGYCQLCNPAAQVHQYQVKGVFIRTTIKANVFPLGRFICKSCIENMVKELRKP